MKKSIEETIFDEANSWIKLNQKVVLATVIQTWGSSPRQIGSRMIVNNVKYNSLFYCLATLDIDLLSDKITLNNEHGPQLTLIKK